MAKTTIDLIHEQVKGRIFFNAPMADLTTIKVGGPADILVYPSDRDDLGRLLSTLTERDVPYFVLGNGSNLVVRDAGIRGAVVSLAEGFRAIERRAELSDRISFWADAGLSLRRLTRWTVDEGVGGLEPLSGIPGTVGGAVAMNAGAWGLEIASRILEVELMDAHGVRFMVPTERLKFGYRSCEIPEGHVVLGALLWGEPRSGEEVKARIQEYLRKRRETQPLQEPSGGSVFKNPPGQSAGKLIDQCGLKGVRVGDAEISRLHGNFIVNMGMATAAQVVALVGMIQERVYVKFKVRLEPEIRIVGDWERGKLRIQE